MDTPINGTDPSWLYKLKEISKAIQTIGTTGTICIIVFYLIYILGSNYIKSSDDIAKIQSAMADHVVQERESLRVSKITCRATQKVASLNPNDCDKSEGK